MPHRARQPRQLGRYTAITSKPAGPHLSLTSTHIAAAASRASVLSISRKHILLKQQLSVYFGIKLITKSY